METFNISIVKFIYKQKQLFRVYLILMIEMHNSMLKLEFESIIIDDKCEFILVIL